MASSHKVAAGLLELSDMDRAGLAAKWQDIMHRPAPKAASRIFLLRALSFELQSKHAPGLGKADLKALRASFGKISSVGADNIREDVGGTAVSVDQPLGPKAKPKRKSSPRLSLVPGSRLVREWNGHAYTVAVIKEGFVYKDRTWSSLSAIAKDITGAHWSGPRFFGLDSAA
ncbi:MAG: DUF2924 domain-containing protein [Alphaproteobacteria bacterium]